LRKFFVAWLAALMLLTALVIPAAAKGPKCADIQSTNSTATQDSRAAFDAGTDQAFGVFFLEGTSCTNITYTLFILDNANSASVMASGSVQGTGDADFVEITVNGVTASDGDVCAYVVTSRGKNVFDRGPAEGCVLLVDDDSSPGGGKGF